MKWTRRLIPALKDNYMLLLSAVNGATIAVDPSEAEPIFVALKEHQLTLKHILCTHHHPDHVGGNLELKERTGCSISGSRRDETRVPGLDSIVSDNYQIEILALPVLPLEIPGHTLGHVAFFFPTLGIVCVGDTLFGMGCGRLFEGTPQQMFTSLAKIARLPPETLVYCGHEYTQALGEFANTLEPENTDLQRRRAEVAQCRAAGQPTVPFTLAEELKTNPFLRPQSPYIRKRLGLEKGTDLEVFTEIRRRKDNI
ncbi:MAG: hydroxyacylglutathione hydrolase [Deltaproteobacteria bacterium]|nr:hydroxyacylglutathione hydrolase [Deltaproteobacteria bacterium]MBI3295658.1 hydroxyacylglutathione hydrolase [Deltaproteobacteria bacterium]